MATARVQGMAGNAVEEMGSHFSRRQETDMEGGGGVDNYMLCLL